MTHTDREIPGSERLFRSLLGYIPPWVGVEVGSRYWPGTVGRHSNREVRIVAPRCFSERPKIVPVDPVEFRTTACRTPKYW
jgi:hypothetical protein